MKKNSTSKSLLAIVLGFLVLFFIFHKNWMLITATSVAAVGVLVPGLARWIEWLWNKLAFALGYVNGRILLTLVFFIVVTPVAYVMKLAGKGNLILKGGRKTYFTDRNHLYTSEDLENPW